ncbi:MAG: dTDP-4-dehydrorhamnose 3,5-epimerase, partial [Desulfosudaceae bacterium]
NLSFSRAGILRGLHFQWPGPQAKLVQVVAGAVFDVAVDIRRGSPTFGSWVGRELSAENRRQLFIPAGFAHGFYVVSRTALVIYKCDACYDPAADQAIRWNDPDIAVNWPAEAPRLSDKDSAAPLLKDVPGENLPVYDLTGKDVE